MRTLFWRLLREEDGDDLVEYALLAGTVGIGSAAALSIFPGVMKSTYESWDWARTANTIWVMPDP